MKNYVFDSYSLMAFFEDEAGAGQVEKILRECLQGKARGYMSVINVGEIFYILLREQGHEKADAVIDMIDKYPIRQVDADWSLTRIAATMKSTHRIAYADCFAAALGKQMNAFVVTGDPEFKQLEKEVNILWLP